jgi:hypothetical protein
MACSGPTRPLLVPYVQHTYNTHTPQVPYPTTKRMRAGPGEGTDRVKQKQCLLLVFHLLWLIKTLRFLVLTDSQNRLSLE